VCIAAGSTSKLLARYRQGGYEALAPHSRRPRSCKHATPAEVAQCILSLRAELERQGHDCGAHTIAHHLRQELGQGVPSVSTIWRILRRNGLVVPQPHKRPRSSLIRFQAELPNEMWQADIPRWALQGLGVAAKNSRPYHRQTCGKVERLHHTLKRYLARQPGAGGVSELQAQLRAFAHYYG
jgi:transposase InsO family protein